MAHNSKKALLPVFILFLLSGATSLAYQVIWTRQLIRVFGATSLAISAVLAAFMAGLALGSYLFGRYIDRRGHPLIMYGCLELGIGLFALLFPFILAGLDLLYGTLYTDPGEGLTGLAILRFGLSFIAVLIPTTLMGGTLPILSRYVAGGLSGLAFRVGWLYSVNTFGAVAGALLTGFVLLPAFGIKTTTLVAVALNGLIFVLSMLLAHKVRWMKPGIAPGGAEPGRHGITLVEMAVLMAFFFTGLAALSAEVIYTRVLKLVVGTTVYAFTTMLTAFLLGLALGSAVFALVAQRTSRPRMLLSLVVLLIGVLVFGSTVVFGRLPIIFMDIYDGMPKTWLHLIGVQFLLSFLILIVPTFFMGATFPLVARIYATDLSRVGGRIGTAYAFNTVGAIVGSLLGTFVFLNLFGVEKGILAVAFIYAVVGVLLFLTISERIRLANRVLAASAFMLILALLAFFNPGWDRRLMTSAVYDYAGSYGDVAGLMRDLEEGRLLFYDEGPAATVTVEQNQKTRALRIDGKVDASNGDDMMTQELLAHLPLLLHEDPDTVLIVGLGSGVTLGSCETHDVEYIDCVEILESVVAAAHYFDEYCRDCQSDPRANILVGDGRTHVHLSKTKYDVLISEPTNVWVEGMGDLFSIEYFEACRERLKPGGVMCCWMHVYQIGDDELRSLLKTFLHVFPNSSVWFLDESDIILIATLSEPRYDLLVERMGEPEIREDLYRVLIDEPEDILSMLLMESADLKRYVSETERFHTDDNMLIELWAGRRILESTSQVHLANFAEEVRPRTFPGLNREREMRVAERMVAKKDILRAASARTEGDLERSVQLYEKAYAMAPQDIYVVLEYSSLHNEIADALVRSGKFQEAIRHYKRALVDSLSHNAWMRYDGLAVAHYSLGDPEAALAYFRKVLETFPENDQALYSMAEIMLEMADTLGAIEHYEKALAENPERSDAANNLAWVYAVRGEQLDRALDLARQSVVADGEPFNYDTLGWVYYQMGDYDSAERALRQALDIDTNWVESIYHLGLVYLKKGEIDRAEALLRQVIQMDESGYFKDKAGAILDEI